MGSTVILSFAGTDFARLVTGRVVLNRLCGLGINAVVKTDNRYGIGGVVFSPASYVIYGLSLNRLSTLSEADSEITRSRLVKGIYGGSSHFDEHILSVKFDGRCIERKSVLTYGFKAVVEVSAHGIGRKQNGGLIVDNLAELTVGDTKAGIVVQRPGVSVSVHCERLDIFIILFDNLNRFRTGGQIVHDRDKDDRQNDTL